MVRTMVSGNRLRHLLSLCRQCSRPCGGGTRSRPVRCFNNVTLEQVPDDRCQGQASPRSEETCNTHDCLTWNTGAWSQVTTLSMKPYLRNVYTSDSHSRRGHNTKYNLILLRQCSETCGQGVSTRRVTCPEVDQCDVTARPDDTRPCLVRACVEWQTLKWSQVCCNQMR